MKELRIKKVNSKQLKVNSDKLCVISTLAHRHIGFMLNQLQSNG